MVDKLGPYELNTIVTGDARKLAKTLPDESIDLLITDPPYFLPVQSYVGTREDGYPKRTLADTSILQTYFDVLLDEFSRILKPSSTAYIFCDGQSYPIIYRAMFPHFKYIRPLIWDKIVSYNGYTWRHQHEIIAWGEGYEADRIPTGDGDILECRGVLQKNRNHPAEKPVELIVKLIAKHGRDQIILDPYCGSAPVAIAAKVTGNYYLAFDLDKHTAALARERVAMTQAPLFTLQPEQLELGLDKKDGDVIR